MKFFCFIFGGVIFSILLAQIDHSFSKEFIILSDSLTNTDTLNKNISDSLSKAVDIKEGTLLYKKNCGKCHSLYEPTDFPIKVWKKNLKEMKIKAGLTENEYNKIFAYLYANCKGK